jgi:diketogulonate reductase-like aldo/keto reductase
MCLSSSNPLQLEYLDLYLVHWPSSLKPGPSVQPPLSETWGAMEEAVDKGLVRAVGVSNFSSVKLGALLEGARVTPAVLQVGVGIWSLMGLGGGGGRGQPVGLCHGSLLGY